MLVALKTGECPRVLHDRRSKMMCSSSIERHDTSARCLHQQKRARAGDESCGTKCSSRSDRLRCDGREFAGYESKPNGEFGRLVPMVHGPALNTEEGVRAQIRKPSMASRHSIDSEVVFEEYPCLSSTVEWKNNVIGSEMQGGHCECV